MITTYLSLVMLVATLSYTRAVAAPTLRVGNRVREANVADRDLHAAYFVIDQARSRLLQAGWWPNPALGFSGARDFEFANEGEYRASSGFEQRFPVADRIARARDVARCVEIQPKREDVSASFHGGERPAHRHQPRIRTSEDTRD